MNEREQTAAFAEEVDKLVGRYSSEFDLTYAAAVGVLVIKAHLLCGESGGDG